MKRITSGHILAIHERIEQAFSDTTAGKPRMGIVESLVDRPFVAPFGTHEVYDTIYKKAACYIESIIRLHPFSDGNKRTAMITAYEFLKINGYHLVVPIDTVKFLISIAKNQDREESEIDELIAHIADWLEGRTATNVKGHMKNIVKYLFEPIIENGNEIDDDTTDRLMQKVEDWFMLDPKSDHAYALKMLQMYMRISIEDISTLFEELKGKNA